MATWSIDTEYGYVGGLDNHESRWQPVCFCAVNCDTGERVEFLRNDPRLRTWISDHQEDTFVAHNAIAEMKYLLRLGCRLPQHWFDTMLAYRYHTNRRNFPRYGLDSALEATGNVDVMSVNKKAMQEMIGRLVFDWADNEVVRRIVEYCHDDTVRGKTLWLELRDRVPPDKMRGWARYLVSVARMELRGIPIDMHLYGQIDEHRDELLIQLKRDINREVPIFDDSGVEKKSLFFEWIDEQRIDWPTKISPTNGRRYRAIDNDTLKMMEGHHPFISRYRQARKTIKALANRDLAIDEHTRRHYFTTMPFGALTSRNAPKGFLMSAPKWMRYLIAPGDPNQVLVYSDFVSQEVGIAAAESGDINMRAMYESADPHLHFAISAGAAPFGATKKTHRQVRNMYKVVSLGLLYGRTHYGLSKQLGISKEAAKQIVLEHQGLFPEFWSWSHKNSERNMLRGECRTRLGWRAKVTSAKERRTFMNFPIQGAGADILRAAMVYLDDQNVPVVAPVHDAVLVVCHRRELALVKEAIDYAYRQAVDDLYPGFPMKWDFEVYHRFADEDGLPMYKFIRQSLWRIRRTRTNDCDPISNSL